MAVKLTPENIMTEISNPKNWKRTVKKNYDVYVCAPRLGTKVHNKLEGSDYIVDNNKRFVISGTVGETWVIDAGKLAKTYSFMDGTPITAESLNKRSTASKLLDWTHIKTLPGGGECNWAIHLPLTIKNFPVNTSWGDTLYANRPGVPHGVGDFILCADAGGQPNLNDCWVVNGEVFPATYDMRAFPGLVSAGKKVSETPMPKSLISEVDKRGVNTNEKGEDATKIKAFMQSLNKRLKENGQYTKITHDTADGNFEKHGGHDLWAITLDKTGTKQALVSFKDGKLAKGTVELAITVNDLEIIKPTQVKSLDHTYELITKTQESLGDDSNKSRRIQYQIVGRYMNGSEVTGYYLQSIDTGKSGKFTKGQVCFLIGRKQVTNCTAQLYKDDVLLRGNGMSLNDLPIINEDGELRNSGNLGNIRKGTKAVDAVNMFTIVGAIKSGRNVVGYVVQNAGCGIKKLRRDQVIKLAQQGKIGNARVQSYNGSLILRGVGCDLGDLPAENITRQSSDGEATVSKNTATTNKTGTSNKVSDGELTIL